MTSAKSPQPISPLRARMIEDMSVRGFKEDTRRDYIRHVRAFAAFISRSPDTARAEELRLFQLHQTQTGMQPPSINSAVSALRFFFTVTLDRPDLARWLAVHAAAPVGPIANRRGRPADARSHRGRGGPGDLDRARRAGQPLLGAHARRRGRISHARRRVPGRARGLPCRFLHPQPRRGWLLAAMV